MNALHNCPSCGDRAEIIDFDVSGDKLWQVSCLKCGMATEMNDERIICIDQWNRRNGEEKLKTRTILLGALLPLGMAIAFLMGLLLGSIGNPL